MARYRGSARDASKHTGDQYSRGFQYRDPDVKDIEFSDWKRMSPRGKVDAGTDILHYAEDCIIRDGIIYPLYKTAIQEITLTGSLTGIGTFSVAIGATEYVVLLYRTSTDKLKIYRTDGTTSVNDTFSSIDVTTSDIARGFQWGGYLYFGSPGIATGLLKYDIVNRTITEVSTAHTALYDLFVVNNNAISVEYVSASNYWLVSWSVDSLPEDWTGAGSGSKIYYNAKYCCAASYDRYAVMMFDRYAERVEATGTADPTFMFTRIESVLGTLNRNTVARIGEAVVYIGTDQKLMALVGDNVRRIGLDWVELETGYSPRVMSIRHANLVMVTFPGSEYSKSGILIDENLNIVGTMYIGWTITSIASITDYAYAQSATYQYKIELLSKATSAIDPPTGMQTSFVDIGEDAVIESIDVITLTNASPTSLYVTLQYKDAVSSTSRTILVTTPSLNFGYGYRYSLNAAARVFNIKISSGTWTNESAIVKVIAKVRKQKLI